MTAAAARNRIERLLAHGAGLPHGKRAKYTSGCRCTDCRRANNDYEKHRNKKRQTNDWNGPADARLVRRHLARLSDAGVGRHAVAEITGISDALLWEVIKGERGIRARNARKILAVTPECAKDRAYVSSAKAWKLLLDLIERGYTKAQLAKWLGYKSAALQFKPGKRMTARNVSRIERLYRLIEAGKMRRE